MTLNMPNYYNNMYYDIDIKVDDKYLNKIDNIVGNKLREFMDKLRIEKTTLDIHMSGKTFNEIFTNSFVKITNEFCADYDKNIYFVDGVNYCKDYMSFCETKELYNELVKQYLESSLYNSYYNEENDEKHNMYDNIANSDVYIWQVVIPDTAKIYINSKTISSDVIILKNKKPLTQHIISSVFDMLNNTDDIKEIEQINYFVKFVKEPNKIELIYKCALMKNINVFDVMPEERKNEKIYLFLAAFPDGYEKIKHNIAPELLMKCIECNINIYKQLTDEKTETIVNYVLDKNILLYEYTPDHYKTIDNTMLYLQKHNNILHIPKNLLNEQVIINKLLENPEYLKYIGFKYKTYEICNNAVQKQGIVLKHTPINLIDINICLNAVINDFNAYQYVPLIYRTTELKEKMVCCHPCSYVLLDEYDITHNIIMHLLTNNHIQVLNTKNINVLSLLALNIMDYYTCCPHIIAIINTDIISTSHALHIVKSDITTYKYFTAKHNVYNFVAECVKYGINFKELSNMYGYITHNVLLELVEFRATIINELPHNMLSDKLFMIALKQQILTLNDIPNEFHTDELISCAYNDLFANNDFIDIRDII